jgi:hypothetical protein
VLKHHGKLLLSTPNYLGPMGLYRVYLRMTGRHFTEVGQPINNLMLLPLTRVMIARVGLKIEKVDGTGQLAFSWAAAG